MNPLQEKLNKIIEGLRELEVEHYGKWKVDRNLACGFVRNELTTLINLTLEEAKKAVPEAWNKTVAPDCNCNMCYAHDKCRQQTLEALDEMKL